MRRLLPVLILALAGCESYREISTITDADAVYRIDGKAYAVRTQFDPLEFAYFNQVTAAEIGPGLTEEDADAVMGILTNEVGAELCDGRQMRLTRFNDQNLPGGGNMLFLESRGMYQVVTRCEVDIPDFFPDAMGLPEESDLPRVGEFPEIEELLPFL